MKAETVVFDCSVFARLLINPRGPAGACLAAAQGGEIRLVVSDPVLAEILELPDKLPPKRGVTRAVAEALVADLAKYAQPYGAVPVVFDMPEDPDDAAYIDLCVAAGAARLLSNDKHLLRLMDRSTEGGRRLADLHPDFVVETPETFVQRRRDTNPPIPDSR